jgi:hypothetical protein
MLKGYSDQLNTMRQAVSKPIIIPDGVIDFVTSVDKGYFPTGGWGMNFDSLKDEPTKRRFLDMACPRLGMTWSYSPSRDAILLDFPWRRDDPRTTQQLVNLLLPGAPARAVDGSKVTLGGQTYYVPVLDDTWPNVFDALLSKSENFPNAWKVRLADDLRREIGFPTPVANLLTSKMKDADAAEHVLIVNSQREWINPGPAGSISYYVFDLQGKFEQGGMCSIGYRCMNASVWLDPGGKQLTLRVFMNGSYQIDEHFALTRKGLVVGDVIDNTGSPMTGYRLVGTCYGLPLLHVPN